MSSILTGFEYDIFISYRHNDNLDGWVTNFVESLEKELKGTLKESLTIYFDKNPRDGLLETHHVDKSLEGKLKCLIFIPIISQTYCDPKSFAWQHEFCAFNKLAQQDELGRDIKLSNGNIASRILPMKIHDLDLEDTNTIGNEIGGALRAIEFIYKTPGVNRPLTPGDKREDNSNKIFYRDQVNKVANAIKEIITPLKNPTVQFVRTTTIEQGTTKPGRNIKIVIPSLLLLLAITIIYFLYQQGTTTNEQAIQLDKSIAVLPFTNMSNDPEQDYFGDGLSEEIINTLVQIQGLKVIARTSSFQFKGKNEDLRTIGQILKVATILEGSVRKSADRIRITAQLIRVSDGSHLWSKTFDKSPEDIISIQEEIAEYVAQELKTTLTLNLRLNHWDDKALKLYQEGRFYYDRGSPEDRVIASKFFERAIKEDSTKATIYAHLAFYYSYIDTAAFDATINRALLLDSTSGEAYIVLADHARSRLDFGKANHFLQKALKYGRSNLLCLRLAGRLLSEWGQSKKAIELGIRAVELDPLRAIQYSQLGTIYLFSDNYAEAIITLRKGLALSPDLLHSHGVLAMAFLLSGKLDEAQIEYNLEQGVEFHRQLEVAILHAQGKKLEANDKFLKFADEFGATAPYMVGSLAARIERPDDCIYWLTKAIENKIGGAEFILVDPFIDPVRNDPRFKSILQKLNYPKDLK